MSLKKVTVSVIIPSFNGAHRISNILTCLSQQSRPADEVIVVIDGSTDNTLQVVKQFQEKLPLNIVIIENQGRAGARNTGVERCSGDLIVFLDDDMRPFENCVADHLQHHQSKHGSLLVGYICEDPKLFTSDIQDYRIKLYKRLGWTRENKPFAPLTENEVFLAAANLSLSKETFTKLDGFDKRLNDAEDFDMGIRAFVMGIEIYYKEHFAQAFHDDLITCKTYIHRQREYSKSRQILYKFKPELYKKYIQQSKPTTSKAKKLVYYMISWNFIVKLIDKGVLRYIIPEKIRHPLYDWIIHGMISIYPDRKLN